MAAHQAPPSLGFSRQEHWSGLPFPSPMHKQGSGLAPQPSPGGRSVSAAGTQQGSGGRRGPGQGRRRLASSLLFLTRVGWSGVQDLSLVCPASRCLPPECTCTHLHAPAHTFTHLHTPAHTFTHLHTLANSKQSQSSCRSAGQPASPLGGSFKVSSPLW